MTLDSVTVISLTVLIEHSSKHTKQQCYYDMYLMATLRPHQETRGLHTAQLESTVYRLSCGGDLSDVLL